MSRMKFSLGISLSDEETEFYANSYEEAQLKANEIFWDNIGVCLVHHSVKGDKEIEFQL